MRSEGINTKNGFFPAALRLCVLALFYALRLCAQPIHFTAFDIFVDSGNVPLAAYQLEFSGPAAQVRITGIEGGEHEAYKTPPFYDPRAIQQERVILAAFNPAPERKLPSGKTRVATIHLQYFGAAKPECSLKFHTAADVDGKAIRVKTTFTERSHEYQ